VRALAEPDHLARGSRTFRDNWDDAIPALLRDAGFSEPVRTRELTSRLGTFAYYRATRPAATGAPPERS